MNISSNKIKIGILTVEGASIPEYMSEGSSGADLRAKLESSVFIKPGGRAVIPTGIKLEIPMGYEIQIRSRSGLAMKHGLMCLNSPGTIDSDYRGEIMIILMNMGNKRIEIKNGDRVAQMVLTSVCRAEFQVKHGLSKTTRDKNGFGSTGEV